MRSSNAQQWCAGSATAVRISCASAQEQWAGRRSNAQHQCSAQQQCAGAKRNSSVLTPPRTCATVDSTNKAELRRRCYDKTHQRHRTPTAPGTSEIAPSRRSITAQKHNSATVDNCAAADGANNAELRHRCYGHTHQL